MTAKGKGYATVADDEGVNYRDIANTMSILGFEMNHSSARNHVLRAMKKFAEAFVDEWHVNVDDEKVDQIAKSPMFQDGVAEMLRDIWTRNL